MYRDKLNQVINKLQLNNESKEKLLRLIPEQKLIDKLLKKDISQEEYKKIYNIIIDTMTNEILKQYPFKIGYNDKINDKLSQEIYTYCNYYYSVEFKETTYKVYPVSIDEKIWKNIYENEIKNIVIESIKTEKSIEILIAEKTQIYMDGTKQYKEIMINNEMEPYQGNPEFMFKRALHIKECANKLSENQFNLDEIICEMKNFYDKYPKNDGYDSYPYLTAEYKQEYINFENNYLKILEIEKKLIPYVEKKWQESLTNPNNHNDLNFTYIIHTFSGGLIPPEEMNKACCTMATSKLLTTPYGNCGLIYDYNPDSIETMCASDAGSWNTSKKEFIDRGLPISWQITNPNGNNIFYENPNISKITLPEDIEKEAIARNAAHNGEILNYEKAIIYSEIYLNSNAKAIGVFYTDDCPNIDKIKEYAQKYNFPLVNLSLKKLRVNANLPEITKEETQNVSNQLSY